MSTISSSPYASRRLPETFFVIALHALLWAAWLVGLLLWVPRVERILRNYNMKAPSATELVMSSTHGIVPDGLLLMLAVLIADGIVYYRLRRSGAQALWSGLMTLTPVAVIIFSAFAISMPLVLMLEALSR